MGQPLSRRPLTPDQVELVASAARLAWWLAGRQGRGAGPGAHPDAYHDAAVDGLIHAARYWRPGLGHRWPQYAAVLIRQRLNFTRRWLEDRDRRARAVLRRLDEVADRAAPGRAEAADEVAALESAAGLSGPQRRAWRRYHGDGATLAEIAATEGVSLQAVSVRCRTALGGLRRAAALRGGLEVRG
jgi:DNA-directed RNA polymerase specialized sigma24 family protein